MQYFNSKTLLLFLVWILGGLIGLGIAGILDGSGLLRGRDIAVLIGLVFATITAWYFHYWMKHHPIDLNEVASNLALEAQEQKYKRWTSFFLALLWVLVGLFFIVAFAGVSADQSGWAGLGYLVLIVVIGLPAVAIMLLISAIIGLLKKLHYVKVAYVFTALLAALVVLAWLVYAWVTIEPIDKIFPGIRKNQASDTHAQEDRGFLITYDELTDSTQGMTAAQLSKMYFVNYNYKAITDLVFKNRSDEKKAQQLLNSGRGVHVYYGEHYTLRGELTDGIYVSKLTEDEDYRGFLESTRDDGVSLFEVISPQKSVTWELGTTQEVTIQWNENWDKVGAVISVGMYGEKFNLPSKKINVPLGARAGDTFSTVIEKVGWDEEKKDWSELVKNIGAKGLGLHLQLTTRFVTSDLDAAGNPKGYFGYVQHSSTTPVMANLTLVSSELSPDFDMSEAEWEIRLAPSGGTIHLGGSRTYIMQVSYNNEKTYYDNIRWFVDDVYKSDANEFVFEPTSRGKYVIKAEIKASGKSFSEETTLQVL
jgi:hypothetical protein